MAYWLTMEWNIKKRWFGYKLERKTERYERRHGEWCWGDIKSWKKHKRIREIIELECWKNDERFI